MGEVVSKIGNRLYEKRVSRIRVRELKFNPKLSSAALIKFCLAGSFVLHLGLKNYIALLEKRIQSDSNILFYLETKQAPPEKIDWNN